MCLRECLALHCMPTLRALAAYARAATESEPAPKSKNLFHRPAAKLSFHDFVKYYESLAPNGHHHSWSSRFFLSGVPS